MNYYRRYVGDYSRDTGDLSLTEHGAYTLLIDFCYATERNLPVELERLYRICFASAPHDQEAVRFVADRFFPIIDGERRHKRIAAELDKARAAIGEMSRAGKEGAAKRWGKNGEAHRVGGGDASRVSMHPPTTNHQPPTSSLHPKKNGIVALTRDAEAVLTFLNEKTGRNYQPCESNLKLITARLRDGESADDIRAVIASRCRKWRGDPKMDEFLRPKTLFSATNYAQYRGELRSEQ